MSQLFDTAKPSSRAVILGVQVQGVTDGEFASSLEEISRLGKTLGLEIIGRVTQKRSRLAPGVVVGEGKLKELSRWTGGSGDVYVGPPLTKKQKEERAERERELRGEVAADAEDEARGEEREPERAEDASAQAKPLPKHERADVVLVDHDLSPSQARNLEKACDAEVIDRSGVILAIFQRHARSREAKLQVEIARLQYVAPRLRETGMGEDRQGGGLAGKGPGESSAELDRRKIRDRIAELRQELAAIERESTTRRKRRSELNKVALVGYTNAGKSSWMRALTGTEVLVQDKLFATLDTTVRALQPETNPRILVSDTVGFIKKLPHDLVASFRSTLDEARECDLLVHVVDASDAAFPAQIDVTRDVLHEIGADESPRLLVLNKSDRVAPEERERLTSEHPNALLLSSRDKADIAHLRATIAAHFEQGMEEADLVVPYSLSKVAAEAHAHTRVISEAHESDGTHLRVKGAPEAIARLKAALPAKKTRKPTNQK
ncbi:MAG: GTPase HflX [Deltaproteobacteria bacterium]|nr:GTPase HflX [Deltaproteobacteria bacterium]